MNQKYDTPVHIIYEFVYSLLLSLILLLGIGNQLEITEFKLRYLVVIFFTLSFFVVLHYLKIRGRILVVSVFVVAAVGLILVAGAEKAKQFYQDNNLLPRVCLLTVVCYVLILCFRNHRRLRNIAALLLLGLLIAGMIMKQDIPLAGVGLTGIYLFMALLEEIQVRWNKQGYTDRESHLVFIMPFLLAYFLVLLAFPVSAKPYDWKFVKDAWFTVKTGVISLTQSFFHGQFEDYDVALSGFSEDGSLISKVGKSNQEIMTIRGGYNLQSNVYLTGKVFDTFDGREWTQKNSETKEERFLDAAETIYGVNLYAPERVSDYVRTATITAGYQYFNTNFLFAPLKTYEITTYKNNMDYQQDGGNMMFLKKRGYGTKYDTRFIQLNVDHVEFYRFLEDIKEENPNIFLRIVDEYGDNKTKHLTYEDLLDYREDVRKYYLSEVPLSAQMQTYLDQITDGAQTDIEKLKQIEKVLSEMTYETNPGKPPKKVKDVSSFLDYFMLESREGFCTYYATAFVLLARKEGIPARYVHGYCVPIKEGKTVMVTSAMAHAWPEAYIEGVGWIPFEPTPGYEELRYTPWKMGDSSDSVTARKGTVQGYWRERELEQQEVEEELPEPLTKQERAQNRRMWMIPCAMVLLFLMLVFLLDRILTYLRFQKKDMEGKFRYQFAYNNRILAMLHLKRRQEETLTEFRIRCVQGMEDGVFDYLYYYEDMIYGGISITEEQYLEAKEAEKKLLTELKRYKKKWFVFYEIWLFGLRYR